MGKLFYELEAIPDKELSDGEYLSMLSKFYYSQPINKVYRDIIKFDITSLDMSKRRIYIAMAEKIFVHGPDKRDVSILMLNMR